MSKSEGAVDRLLAAIEQGEMGTCRAFARDVVLDATVPNWRFTVTGPDAVRDELEKRKRGSHPRHR